MNPFLRNIPYPRHKKSIPWILLLDNEDKSEDLFYCMLHSMVPNFIVST
jgi:hypothetical protein